MVARLIQATVLLPGSVEIVNGSRSIVYVYTQSWWLPSQSV